MRKTAIALLLALSPFVLAAAPADLAGLWKAKRRFGPDTRGPLVIERHAEQYTADFSGVRIPVTVANGELTFPSPRGDGSFHGKLEKDGTILAHWFKEGTAAENNRSATTVLLRGDGPNRWRGAVEPLYDEFTFYLLLKNQPDGTMSALLRNHERDVGTQWGVNRLVRDGETYKLIATRGGKDNTVGTGFYDSDTGILSLFIPNRGGTYDFTRENDSSDFYPRGAKPQPYVYRTPTRLDDGWPTGSLDDANISRAGIERLVQSIIDTPMDSPDAPQVHALLIARHGKIVLEEYFHGETRDHPHVMRSASKSVTSVLAGAAIYAGAPLSLDSKVYELMKEDASSEPAKRAMTLENLLTMSGGFFCDDTNDAAPGNEETMTNQDKEPDYYRFTMRVPLATPPGENAVYCSAMPNLALGMVGVAVGESPMYTFDRLVAEPMNIRRFAWGIDSLNRPYGGGSMYLTARDFTKFGQLMLNGGTWNGRRILSEAFAKASTSPLYHLRNIKYGYLWWGEDYPYKSRTVYAYSARGAGGQTVTVVPALDLIVTTLAGSYASRKGAFAASQDMVPHSILPAVREAGDDPNTPVVDREYKSPYGPSKDGSRIQRP